VIEQLQLTHAKVVLILDRTLSPAGERRLKDLRCLGRAGGAEDFAWPSPAVFNIPKFANKICTALAQKNLIEPRPAALRFEELLLRLWMECKSAESFKKWKNLSLKSFEQELKIALKFATLGLTQEELISLLAEVEEGAKDSADFSLWGKRILLYLTAQKWAAQKNIALTVWDNVFYLTHEIDVELLKQISWLGLLERHPFKCSQEDISFVIPEIQSPQVVEKNFLKKLSQIFKVTYVARKKTHASSETFFLSQLEAAVANPKASLKADDVAIAWTFELEAPGPIETLCALSGQYTLDLALKTREDENIELRMLGLFSDYLADTHNSQHPFHRFQKDTAFLRSWKLMTDNLSVSDTKLDVKTLIETWVEKTNPELSQELLENISTQLNHKQVAEFFLYLSKSSIFCESIEELVHPRLAANGVPLLTLPDLALAGAKEYWLWGSRKDFEKFLAPQSSHVLKQQDWPLLLRRLLDARGLALPDPEEEQELLLGSLESLGTKLKILETPWSERSPLQAAPQWQEAQLLAKDSLSPSALEAYHDCSLRYYFERILKPERIEDWDPVPLNPMEYGNWVHVVLEKFLQNPDWDQLDSVLLNLIQAEQKNLFQSPHSPAYQKILSQESEILFEKLRDHLKNFEAPLLHILGPRTQLQAELTIKSSWQGRNYHGKVDRLDTYNSQWQLLWDYKTGHVQNKHATQVNNGKFQWHLYRALLSSEKNICGGGYLNPLDASKSNLILFTSQFPHDKTQAFFELAENTGHKIEIADTEAEDTIAQNLEAKLSELHEKMQLGILAPEGDIKKDCPHCSARALCGKVYLEAENDSMA
jgi:gas vesicle protein